jgi:hypothetical protein
MNKQVISVKGELLIIISQALLLDKKTRGILLKKNIRIIRIKN